MKQQEYQEALDKLIQDYNDLIQQSSNLSQYYEWYDTQEKIDKLQELVDKATPMKPIKDKEQPIRYTTDYICANCKNHFTGTGIADYCYHCGQAIDWSGF